MIKDTAIYIGFSKPIKFKIGAAAIQVWQGRPYSHTYVRFEPREDIPSNVYHAAHGMVHFMTFDRFKTLNTPLVEYKIEMDQVSRKKILIHCMTLAGEKYSQLELVKIVLMDTIWSLFGKQYLPSDSDGYICSELVGNICESQLNMKFDKPLCLLKPTDVEFEIIKVGIKSI